MIRKMILALLLLNATAYAQTESAANKIASAGFERSFNAGEMDSIFALFAPQMQKALPIEKTREFLNGLHAEGGKIIEREFVGYERGSYATYKTKFERTTLALRISADNKGLINGLFAGPYTDRSAPKPARNTVKLGLPFKGTWTVSWGGDTPEQNYHVESVAQKNAFDLVITDAKGSSYRGSGEKNEDHYAFGQPIYAPCDGEVVLAVDGVKDNEPGTEDPNYVPGNTVILKIGPDQYAFFAHFKQFSVAVKQGQKVKRGALLGRCGNTGHSSEPHLHFHLQNLEDMNKATGIKCYFDRLKVNGQIKTDYSPLKDEKISGL